MSTIAWIIMGTIAGFIASKVVSDQGGGLIRDLALGIVGAILGGFLFEQFGARGVTGVNVPSMLVALFGSIAVLAAYNMLLKRRISA